MGIRYIVLLFLDKNICCGYSLEAPRWGASNEYPQYMFLSRIKKNIDTFLLKKAPYQELCWVVIAPNFWSWGAGFKSCWRRNSAPDCMAFHCTVPFIIILPSSWYDLDYVERDVKHQLIIIHKTWPMGIWFSYSQPGGICFYTPPHNSGGVWFHIGYLCVCPSINIFVSIWQLEYMSMDFHQTWYVHWYCGDLVWDC